MGNVVRNRLVNQAPTFMTSLVKKIMDERLLSYVVCFQPQPDFPPHTLLDSQLVPSAPDMELIIGPDSLIHNEIHHYIFEEAGVPESSPTESINRRLKDEKRCTFGSLGLPLHPLSDEAERRADAKGSVHPYSDDLGHLKNSVEIVVGLFPFGDHYITANLRSRIDLSTAGMLEHLEYIAPNGFGVFLIRRYYSPVADTSLEVLLDAAGFHLLAVINTPEDAINTPQDTQWSGHFRPIVVVVGRAKPEKVFFLDPASGADLILGMDGFFTGRDSSDPNVGVWEDHDEFIGFQAWDLKSDLDAIGGDYTTFEQRTLANICIGVHHCKIGEQFVPVENAIYIPVIGHSLVVNDLPQSTLKHHNYAQAVLDDSKASPEFVLNFLNSKYGKALLRYEKEHRGNKLPVLQRSQLYSLSVSLPPLETQHEISATIEKLARLRLLVTQLEENISINPISSTDSLAKIDTDLESFGALTYEHEIYAKIKRGESKTVEFKQTLRLDIKEKQAAKYLEEASIKTIAGFLNSNGGDLFVGVSDAGEITGVQEEIDLLFKGNRDGFLRHVKNLIKDQIGAEHYPFIDHDLTPVGRKHIWHVRCKPSGTAVFVNQDLFYVRTNPATDQLKGAEMMNYINTRFGPRASNSDL